MVRATFSTRLGLSPRGPDAGWPVEGFVAAVVVKNAPNMLPATIESLEGERGLRGQRIDGTH
jgi:hypothetical protein